MKHSISQSRRARIIFLGFIALFCACGVKPKTPEQAAIGIPNIEPLSGQIVVSLSDAENMTDVSGYIVSRRDSLKLESDQAGKFFISGIPPGKHDLVLTATAKSSALWLSGKRVGVRIKDIDVLPGRRTEKTSLSMPELKTLEGRVTLADASESAGVEVYVPGTSYSALTDAQGYFRITELPAGIHNLFVEKTGYRRGKFEGIEIQSQSTTTNVAELQLIIDTGVEGVMLINSGSQLSTNKVVNVSIAVPDDAALMKVSERENFEGAGWKPLRTSFSYSFDSDGAKTLFAKVANANGLESSPFRANIDVRSQPLTPTLSLVNSRCSEANKTLVIKVSEGATTPVDMRIFVGQVSDSQSWEPYSSQKIIAKSSITAPLTVQVRDARRFTAQERLTSYECILSGRDERYTFATAVSGSKLFVAGGVIPYPYSWSKALDVLDVSNNQLQSLELSQARESVSTAVVGSKVVFAGGGGNASVWANVEVYDTNTNTLSVGVPLSEARAVSTAAVVGGKAIFAGGTKRIGSNFEASSRVDIYDAATDTWSQAELSAARSPTSVVFGTRAFFFGTGNSSQLDGLQLTYTNIDIFDSSTNTWSRRDLSSERNPTTVIVGNKLLFAGGFSAAGGMNGAGSAEVDIFDGTNWTTGTLSIGRSVGCKAVVGEFAYFIGGSSALGSTRVDVYNSSNNSWSNFTLTQGASTCTTEVVGSRIYVFGLVSGSYSPNSYLTIDTSNANFVSEPNCPFCVTDPRPDGMKRSFTGLNPISFDSKIFFSTSALERNSSGWTYPVDGRLDILNTLTGSWASFKLAQPRTQGRFIQIGNRGVLLGGWPIGTQTTNNTPIFDVIDLITGENLSTVRVEL